MLISFDNIKDTIYLMIFSNYFLAMIGVEIFQISSEKFNKFLESDLYTPYTNYLDSTIGDF